MFAFVFWFQYARYIKANQVIFTRWQTNAY